MTLLATLLAVAGLGYGLALVADDYPCNTYRCKGSLVGENCLYRCVATPCDDQNGSRTATAVDCVDGDGSSGPEAVILDEEGKLVVNLGPDDVSTVYVYVINYVRGLGDLNNRTYRLLKTNILKIQLATPGDSSLTQFINGSVMCFNEDPEQNVIVDSPFGTNCKLSLMEIGRTGLGYNDIINEKVLLQISEIRAIFDSDDSPTVNLRVYVTNLGLKSAEFFAEVSNQSTKNLQKAIVHPQQTVEVRLPYECTTDVCFASVHLFDSVPNDTDAVAAAAAVASRKFGAVRGHRCYCPWHMRCSCYDCGTASGTCLRRPFAAHGGGALSQAEYNGAGFPGDVPPECGARGRGPDWDLVSASLELLCAHVLLTLLLGVFKALTPRCRSRWLWTVNSDWLRELKAYREPELRPWRLTRDERGFYVHPTTGSRDIQLMGAGQQFVTNVLFFAGQPLSALLYWTRPKRYPPSSRCGGSSIAIRAPRPPSPRASRARGGSRPIAADGTPAAPAPPPASAGRRRAASLPTDCCIAIPWASEDADCSSSNEDGGVSADAYRPKTF